MITTPFKLKRGHILGLRTNAPDMKSYGGFQWPKSGKVTAPDWKPKAECGNGLHFLPWGEGNPDFLHNLWNKNTQWLVISTPKKGVIDLGGKSKCAACEVVYSGERQGAIEILSANAPVGTHIVYGTATAGYGGTATAGNYGTATAGYCGTATAGDRGTATAGDRGTATAGYCGTATAGDRGTATAGDRGTATAGDRGTATAGYCGTVTAGDCGVISIEYWDSKKERSSRLIGYTGDGELKPNVAYRINDQCQFEEVTS